MHGQLGRGGWSCNWLSKSVTSRRLEGLEALGAGDGGDMHTGCAGAEEGLAAGAGRSAGGVDVVDEEDVSSCDVALGVFACDGKSATDVGTSLARAEACLTLRGPAAGESVGSELQLELRLPAMEAAREGAGEMLCLIESPASFASAMERYGHDEQGWRELGNGENALGEHCAETKGDGLDAVVLEQVEEGSEFVLIEAPCDGEGEGWRGGAAEPAERLRRIGVGTGGDAEVFSAAGAEGFGLGMEKVPAGRADGRGGEFSERGGAEAAGRWDQDRGDSVERASGRTSKDANHCAPCRCFGRRMIHGRRMLHAAEDSPHAASRTESARLPYGHEYTSSEAGLQRGRCKFDGIVRMHGVTGGGGVAGWGLG